MFLGYGRGEIGAAFAALAFALCVVSSRGIKVKRTVAHAAWVTFMFSVAGAATVGMSGTSQALNIMLNMVTTSMLICAAAMLTIDRNTDVVLRTTNVFLRAVVYLSVITSLMLFFGIDPISIKAFDVDVANRSDGFTISVLFPGGANPFLMTTAYGVFHRAIFWCIEPGVAPFLLTLWRILDRSDTRLVERFRDVVFIIGLLATMSTTAPVALGLYYFSRLYVSRGVFSIKANILAVIVIFGTSSIFFFFPAFGYLEKLSTHGSSFDDRIVWYTNDDGAISRIITAVLVAGHLLCMHAILGRTVFLIAPIAFLVSVLNVLEFTALYSMGILLMACAPLPVGTPSRLILRQNKLRVNFASRHCAQPSRDTATEY